MRFLLAASIALAAPAAALAQPSSMVRSWGYFTHLAPAGHFSKIAVGDDVAAGLRLDGTLAVWSETPWNTPVPPPNTFIYFDIFNDNIVALDSDGRAVTWGAGPPYQLPGGTYKAVATGPLHAIFIKPDGTLAGVGNNSYGQTNVPAGTFTKVDCGYYHSVGIRTDGALAAWGDNGAGQTNVPAGTFIDVAAGGYHNIALRSDGAVLCWGDNLSGQLNMPAGTYIDVDASYEFSVALRADGTIASAGYHGVTPVAQAGEKYWQIAAGSWAAAALKTAPVTINAGPTTVFAPASQTAMLAVSATSAAPLEYRWMRDGETIVDGGRVSGATTPTLLIQNAGLDDEGAYTVVVSNYTGQSQQTTINLTVTPYAAPGPDAGFDPYSGHAMLFDGVGTHVTVPHSTAHNQSDNFTVEAWVRLDGQTGQWRVPLASQDFFDGGLPRRGYLFIIRDSVWECWMGAGSAYTVLTGPEVRPGKWTHLAVVRSGFESRFYVDGQLAATSGFSTYISNNRNPLVIGCGLNTSNQPAFGFPGAVDEVRIWSAARTAAQIRSLMNVAPDANDPALVGWWRFDEGEGSTVADHAPAAGALSGTCPVANGWFETFGPYPAGAVDACPSDLTGDGLINAADLAQMLGAWGACR